MTSYPARFQSLLTALENVMKWTRLPKRIYLNVSTFDVDKLPSEIKSAKYRELLMVNPTLDLGPCTKLIPMLELEGDFPIVTIDDDALFKPNRIEQLLSEHALYPESIIAGRTHPITRNSSKQINPYLQWDLEQNQIEGPSKELFPTGVGMVLYPQNSMHEDVKNKDLIQKYSRHNDDLWHYFQARRVGTQIRQVPERAALNLIEGTQDVGLWNSGNQTRNDVIVKSLVNLYGDPLYFD